MRESEAKRSRVRPLDTKGDGGAPQLELCLLRQVLSRGIRGLIMAPTVDGHSLSYHEQVRAVEDQGYGKPV